jgi:2-oxoglutarate dehydrogenase complex dehydrogenase (E1) component-like enzyme
VRAGIVEPPELRELAGALCASPAAMARHASLVQYAFAAAASLSGERARRWEALATEEAAMMAGVTQGTRIACIIISSFPPGYARVAGIQSIFSRE